jgi:hypothetical protein
MPAAVSNLMCSQSHAEPGRNLVEKIGSYLIAFQSQACPVEEAIWHSTKR